MGIKTSEILDLVSNSSPFYAGAASFETEFTMPYHLTNIVTVNTGLKPDYTIVNGMWLLNIETQCMNEFADTTDNGFLRYVIKWSTPGPLPTVGMLGFAWTVYTFQGSPALIGQVNQFKQVIDAGPSNAIGLNASGELLFRFRNNITDPLSQYMKFKVTAAPVRQLPFFAFDIP